MHPGFLHWWKEAQRHHHAQHGHAHHGASGCGPQARAPSDDGGMWAVDPESGAGFGVRRPLRFMAQRLELREEQVEQLAAILDGLKTERAQAAVDHRRSVGQFADAMSSETFDEQAADAAAHARVKSAEQLKAAVVQALARTHKMLDAEQRKQLAYLLRSGQLTI